MAYYAALVSLVELLKEINNPENPYSNPLLEEHEIHVSLYEKLSNLQELLEDYSPKDHTDESADFLQRRIKDVSYQVQDIIENQISKQRCKALGLDIDIQGEEYYEELEKLKFEVHSIVDELVRIKVGSNTTHEDRFLTKLKSQLCGESSKREVVSIVGTGGTGKTTLARNIFADKSVDHHFDCRAWVSVSQDYHLRKLLLVIGNSLNIIDEKLSREEEEVLRLCIYQHLFGKRYLIIMDDVWIKRVWDDVKVIFPDNHNGSRIMTTTRNFDVACYASSSDFVHQIPFLNEDQSWNLFCEKVFCPAELEDIGRLIAKHCGGLPLAIVVVAGLLSKVNKTRHDWEEIAKDLRSAAIKNDDHLSNILSLSYNHLPHHLKPCFLYLGGFPEDYEMRVPALIKSWVAEGFLKQNESRDLEELGEWYLADLVSRNLVVVTKKRSNGKFKYCNIHDILREFCLQKARYENFLVVHESDTIGNARRLYIPPGSSFLNREDDSDVISISNVRSVLFFGDCWDNIDSYVSEFKLLRVLDALSMDFDSFPIEIVELLHLRFLALQCSECHIPPSIFKLQNLQTLIIHGMTSLPSEIWKMPQLRHVMCSRMTLPPIPYDKIRIINGAPLLGMLQTLCTVVNFTFTREIVGMIRGLKKLTVLICGNEHCENWVKFGLNNLTYLRNLEILDINFAGVSSRLDDVILLPNGFSFPMNLKKLTLEGCRLPWRDMTVVALLPNLQVLKLKDNAFVGKKWEPIEGEFLELNFLLIERLYNLKYWLAEDIHFPRLEHLHIISCLELKEIPSGIGDILTLQLIELTDCSRGLQSSAFEILKEQQEYGNDALLIRIEAFNCR